MIPEKHLFTIKLCANIDAGPAEDGLPF